MDETAIVLIQPNVNFKTFLILPGNGPPTASQGLTLQWDDDVPWRLSGLTLTGS